MAPTRHTRRLGFRLPALVAPGGACLVWRQDRGTHSYLSSELPQRRHKGAKYPRQPPGIEEPLAELCTNQRRSVNRVAGPRAAKPLTLRQEGLYLLNRSVTGWIEEELALGNGEGVAPCEASQTSLVLVETRTVAL